MRYPLWAFLFVFVLPPFTAHALLSDRAEFRTPVTEQVTVSSVSVKHYRF